MAWVLKRMGAGNAVVETALYSCPSGGQAQITSIIVRNASGLAATFDIAHVESGGGNASADDFLFSGESIAANATRVLSDFGPLGLTLDEGESIRVHGSSTSIYFIAQGTEAG